MINRRHCIGDLDPLLGKVKFVQKLFFFSRLSEVKMNISHPDEEVDHEEYIEGQVNLLSGVLRPGDALLHSLTETGHQSVNPLPPPWSTYFPASMK